MDVGILNGLHLNLVCYGSKIVFSFFCINFHMRQMLVVYKHIMNFFLTFLHLNRKDHVNCYKCRVMEISVKGGGGCQPPLSVTLTSMGTLFAAYFSATSFSVKNSRFDLKDGWEGVGGVKPATKISATRHFIFTLFKDRLYHLVTILFQTSFGYIFILSDLDLSDTFYNFFVFHTASLSIKLFLSWQYSRPI